MTRISTLISSLLDLAALDRLPRTGWILRGVPEPESIAGHTLGTALLALSIGPDVEPKLDMARVLAMTLVHDAPEAWTGDLPKRAAGLLPAGAKTQLEERVAQGLFEPMGASAGEAFREYTLRETREARFAHLCDKLQLGVRLIGYERAGHAGLEEFHVGLRGLDCSEFDLLDRLKQEILSTLSDPTHRVG